MPAAGQSISTSQERWPRTSEAFAPYVAAAGKVLAVLLVR